MNQGTYQRLKHVFHEAVELEPQERTRFVARECGDDEALRLEVEQLLLQHDSSEGFLEKPLRIIAPEGDPSEGNGAAPSNGSRQRDDRGPPGELRFASYTVRRTLGRGGMGVVYLAEQDGTRRTVALKVIRPGLATSGALKRFAFEAQVLGRLNHSGIAQIYEAGTADAGHGPQPYFAMELVDGVPITQHARLNSLTIPQRLALLAQVCDAVEYAHVKGVIHRDLKPGNIFVDGAGQVKVLDFGVARATTPAPESGAGHAPSPDSGAPGIPSQNTEPGQLIGTLPYMSPEQIAGDPDDLDTRSDVYTLGVIGYELLAGTPAYAIDRLPPLEAARVVKDTDPAPLSSFSTIYRGDIETVIAKAMDKDRDRRYQSAATLAKDIRRHLSDEPIEARPTSAWRQTIKFARRNRPAAIAACAVAGTLIFSFVGISLFASREAGARATAEARAISEAHSRNEAESATATALQERAEADRQRAISVAVTEFMLHVFSAAHTEVKGRDVTVLEAFQRAEERLDSGSLDPEVEIAARRAIGSTLNSLAQYADAERILRKALERAESVGAPDDPVVLSVLADLVDSLLSRGAAAEAEPLIRRVVDGRTQQLGPDHELTLERRVSLAKCLTALARYDEAEATFKDLIRASEEHLGDSHITTVLALDGYANLLSQLERYTEAEPLYRRALALASASLGEDHARSITILNNLGVLLSETGRLEEAAQALRRVVLFRRRILGPENPRTLTSVYNLARLVHKTGGLDEAEALFQEIVELKAHAGIEKNPTLADSLAYLGRITRARGRLDQALDFFNRAVATASQGPDSHRTTQYGALLDSVWCLMDAGNLDEAVRRLNVVRAWANGQRPTEKPLHISVLKATKALAERRGHPEEAAQCQQQLIELGEPENPSAP